MLVVDEMIVQSHRQVSLLPPESLHRPSKYYFPSLLPCLTKIRVYRSMLYAGVSVPYLPCRRTVCHLLTIHLVFIHRSLRLKLPLPDERQVGGLMESLGVVRGRRRLVELDLKVQARLTKCCLFFPFADPVSLLFDKRRGTKRAGNLLSSEVVHR